MHNKWKWFGTSQVKVRSSLRFIRSCLGFTNMCTLWELCICLVSGHPEGFFFFALSVWCRNETGSGAAQNTLQHLHVVCVCRTMLLPSHQGALRMVWRHFLELRKEEKNRNSPRGLWGGPYRDLRDLFQGQICIFTVSEAWFPHLGLCCAKTSLYSTHWQLELLVNTEEDLTVQMIWIYLFFHSDVIKVEHRMSSRVFPVMIQMKRGSICKVNNL